MPEILGTANVFENKNKNSDKHPDFRNNVEISEAMVEHLNDCKSRGKPAEVQICIYKNRTKNGDPYVRLSFQTPYEPRGGRREGRRDQRRERPRRDDDWDDRGRGGDPRDRDYGDRGYRDSQDDRDHGGGRDLDDDIPW